MKLGASSYFRRSVMLAAACVIAVVLTACTGKGGGYLPPHAPAFTGQASFGFTFSCEKGDLKIELSYNEKGRSLEIIGSPFGIHGIVDNVNPVVESGLCIDENPPPPPENQLRFLGGYYLTSSAPSGFPSTCPKKQTSTSPLCRFEVTVQDNDRSLSPSPGDYFSITLSNAVYTCTDPQDFSCSQLPADAMLFYTRAGYLAGGNITVK
jgi:hypothetical protein